MRIDYKLITTLSLALAGCGGCGEDGPGMGAPDAAPSTPDAAPDTGAIAGKVIAEHAGGSDVVAGALVSVAGGPSTTTDATGDFLLEGVSPGDDVLVVVRGPRAADPDDPFVFSSYRGHAAVAVGETTEIAPVLVPGCERELDAAAGATLDVANCGGAGRAELVFPAGALVRASDDSAFDGLARVELAINDPVADAQVMALPAPDESSEAEVYGAIEVRLYDALTGDALQVAAGASVEVSVEVAGAINTASGAGVYLIDPSTHGWVEEAPGAIETRAGRTYYRFTATHFSQRAVAYVGPGNPTQSCIQYTISPPDARAPMVQLRSSYRWRIRRVDASGCVEAWPNASVQIRAVGYPGVQSPSRILSGWEATTTGNPIADACGGSATGCGSASLHIGPEGCIDGTFESQRYACQGGGPVQGMISFRRDGITFERRMVGNVCSAFFGTVWVPPGNGPVYISDSAGSQISWSPSFPSSSCTNLGTQTAAGYGLRPTFVARVTHNLVSGTSGANDPGSTYNLQLDASASEGMIHTYAWDLYRVNGGSETPVWSATSATDTTGVDVDDGRYRIRLRIYAGASLVAERSELKDVPGPTASFTFNPDPPLVDQLVSFDASASLGSPVSYEWDFDNDGTFDATGVTASHTYTSAGPVEIRLRVTDGNGAIDERVAATTVAANLPANTIRLTLTNAGQVREQAGSFVCDGPAVCQHTFPGNVLLESYNTDGTPNQGAWAAFPGADGYQAYFNFAVQPSYDLSVTF